MNIYRVLPRAGLLGLLVLLQACSHLLFYPSPAHVLQPDDLGIEYRDIEFNAADGTRLHGWWLYTQAPRQGTVLFFHGNAENISTHIGHVYWLVGYGYDVVAVDYRGYGKSAGTPSLDGSVQDIQATLAYVDGGLATPGEPMFVIGQSIGGSLSVAALAQSELKQRLSGIIIIGSFSDYHKITRQALSGFWLTWPLQWPLSFTVDNSYSPEKFIARLSPVPLLIMHGEYDQVVPVEHGRRLFELAQPPKFLEQVNGDHNHIMKNSRTRELLLEYLQRFSARP